jgi:hypothetical protein
VKCADELLLLAKEETALMGMTDVLVYVRRCYEMEMSVEKSKVMGISWQPSPVQITYSIDKRELDIVEYFKYFGSTITSDTR